MTEVVVVGAGPAGIAAACRADESGANVTLLDDNPYLGGQIWRYGAGYSVPRKAKRWFNRLDKADVVVRAGETVIDITGSAVQVQTEGDSLYSIAFDKLILATGSRELFIPFPGWTLPNVMGAGGAQALLKAGMPVKGRRVVVGGSGPLLFAVAGNLAKAGAKIVCIAEQASRMQLANFALGVLRYSPSKMLQGVGYNWQYFPTPYRLNTWVKEARGDSQVREVVLTDGKKQRTEPCDMVACAYGFVPNVELAFLAGCKQKNGRAIVDHLQRTPINRGIFCAGEITGIGGVELAITEGEIAGLAAAGNERAAKILVTKHTKQLRFARLLDNCFALKDQLRDLPTDDTIICRCEDVTYGELKNQTDQRSAKLYTRCGMGSCQGRICSSALTYLLGWDYNRVRPPAIPTKVGSFLTGDR